MYNLGKIYFRMLCCIFMMVCYQTKLVSQTTIQDSVKTDKALITTKVQIIDTSTITKITSPKKLSTIITLGPGKRKPLFLTVTKGTYQIKSGTTLKEGSAISVNEDWLIFPNGLAINIEGGEITLKGKKYNDGSKLLVDDTGALIKRK